MPKRHRSAADALIWGRTRSPANRCCADMRNRIFGGGFHAARTVRLSRCRLLLPCCSPASAQSNWPTRPVTLVVGFAAGGGTDVLARIVARKVSEVLGQQIIIENVGGAGGMVGSARVAKSPPDGYTIVMGTPRRRHQPDALQEAGLQPGRRSGADRADRRSADHPHHAQRISGQHPAGVHRLREKEPGDAEGRLGRRRLDRHDRLPAAQRRHRRQRHPRALSRRRPGDAGHHRRPRRLHLHADRLGGAAGRGQDRQGDRRAHQGARADAARTSRVHGSRASRISKPRPGSASWRRRARRSRSSRSCTTPPSRRWRTKRCRSRCWRRARSSCRRSGARPNI